MGCWSSLLVAALIEPAALLIAALLALLRSALVALLRSALLALLIAALLLSSTVDRRGAACHCPNHRDAEGLEQ